MDYIMAKAMDSWELILMRYINVEYGLPFDILVNQWNHDPIAKESMIGAAAFPHIPSLHPCPVGFELHFGSPWCFVWQKTNHFKIAKVEKIHALEAV